jgi:uncharacterized membrane protein YhaH (DUF805 family)
MLRLLFSFSGRISHAQYWRACLMLAAFGVAVFTLLFVAMAATRQGPPVVLLLACGAVYLTLGTSWFAIHTKRRNDLGGVEAIGRFPPFASFCIMFCEGEAHANVYGPPPEDRPR